MKSLHAYVGRLVKLRPAIFMAILNRARTKNLRVENSFLVATANRRTGMLVCYGAEMCLSVVPADVVVV